MATAWKDLTRDQKDHANERKRNLYAAKVAYVDNYKRRMGCSVVGCCERRPKAIQLHHKDFCPTVGYSVEKEDSLANLIAKGASWERIDIEMAKCIPICANDHHILHHELRKYGKIVSLFFKVRRPRKKE